MERSVIKRQPNASRFLQVVLVVGALGAAASEGRAWGGHRTLEFADAIIRVEINSTDGDAGFQIFLDGEGWKSVRVYDPYWHRILHVEAKGGVRGIGGGTELFLETEEPQYGSLRELQKLLDRLREGTYRFFGTTAGGDPLVGRGRLTHDVPAGPVITSPLPEDEEECAEDVPTDDAVIAWDPVTTTMFGSTDIEIVGYRVIVDDEEAGRTFEIELPADAMEVTVPPDFLEPGTEYTFEILAIEESDNQTISEACFETEE